MSTPVWCLTITTILVLATVLVRSTQPSAMRVVVMHNAAWAGALTLLGTGLVQYNEYSSVAWLSLLTGILSFNLGAMFALSPKRGANRGRNARSPQWFSLVTRRQVTLLLMAYSLGFAVYLWTIQARFGLSTLVVDPTSIRAAAGESYLESVPLWARALVFLGPLLVALYGWKHAVTEPLPKVVRFTVVVALLASQAALLQRTNLFVSVLLLAAVLVIRPIDLDSDRAAPQHTTARRLAALVVTGIVLLSAFQAIGTALGKDGSQTLITGRVDPVLADSGLTSAYIYATGGTVALLSLVESENGDYPPPAVRGTILVGDYNPQTWGTTTFQLPLKVVPLAEPFPTISPFTDIGVLTNVYTWLEPWYRDFRLAGLLLGPFVIGCLASTLHARRFHSIFGFWACAALLSTVLFAPFSARFHSTIFAVTLVVIAILSSTRARTLRSPSSGTSELRVRPR